jgi:hypothetical protein
MEPPDLERLSGYLPTNIPNAYYYSKCNIEIYLDKAFLPGNIVFIVEVSM